MIAKPIPPGIVEFCLPDRTTILMDTFVIVDESNKHLLKNGVQFITNQIRDVRNNMPILLTSRKDLTGAHLATREKLGYPAYWTCLIFKEVETVYKNK